VIFAAGLLAIFSGASVYSFSKTNLRLVTPVYLDS
jgi:hypothetical protein